MKQIHTYTLIILAIMFTFNVDSKAKPDDLEFSKSIPAKNIKHSKIDIFFPFGELNISTNTNKLLSADCEFNKEMWRPKVTVKKSKNKSYFTISTPDGTNLKAQRDEDQSEWDINLNKSISYDLDISITAGESDINLTNSKVKSLGLRIGAGEIEADFSNSTLEDFSFSMGAGEATFDFSALKSHHFDGNITGAVGEVNVILPKNMGIKVKVTGLLGEVKKSGLSKNGSTYTSKNYGKTDKSFILDIVGVIGEVQLKVEE